MSLRVVQKNRYTKSAYNSLYSESLTHHSRGIFREQLKATGREKLFGEGNTHTHTHTHTHTTDTHSPLFQSTGQSDQLIGDFEGPREGEWLVEPDLAADCLAPLSMSPFARPGPGDRPMRRQQSKRSCVAWPCYGAQRSEGGWMDDNIRNVSGWSMAIHSQWRLYTVNQDECSEADSNGSRVTSWRRGRESNYEQWIWY